MHETNTPSDPCFKAIHAAGLFSVWQWPSYHEINYDSLEPRCKKRLSPYIFIHTCSRATDSTDNHNFRTVKESVTTHSLSNSSSYLRLDVQSW